MRNWNERCFVFWGDKWRVLSLPMRNWNLDIIPHKIKYRNVLSLPMRNWNIDLLRKEDLDKLSFKPTYEELKQERR